MISLVIFMFCFLSGWLGYILRGAENYHRGYIDGCNEREEYKR
jgi:hypothetical protein